MTTAARAAERERFESERRAARARVIHDLLQSEQQYGSDLGLWRAVGGRDILGVCLSVCETVSSSGSHLEYADRR